MTTNTTTDKPQEPSTSQIHKLIDIGNSNIKEIYHDQKNTGYADVMVDGIRRTMGVNSRQFEKWLMMMYSRLWNLAPSDQALKTVIRTLDAKATDESSNTREVFLRVGHQEGKMYIDLCDPSWQAIEVSSTGWKVVSEYPVRFRRTITMQEIPEPKKSGSIKLFKKVFNVQNKSDLVLIVSWLLSAMRRSGEYPLLSIYGEQGSAKSTCAKHLKMLIDPVTGPNRKLMSDARDFMVLATNNHLLSFDNLSSMNRQNSDILCTLSTGSGFSTRELHTNDNEIVFESANPMILNGIVNVANAPDLADRCVNINLKRIDDKARKESSVVFDEFNKNRPLLLGVLLDGLSEGLRNQSSTHLEEMPRMAEFAKWSTACETAYWRNGTFATAYQQNIEESIDRVLHTDPVAATLIEFIESQTKRDKVKNWSGTYTELLTELNRIFSPDQKKLKDGLWPSTTSHLSNRINRIETILRKKGYDIDRSRTKSSKTIRIEKRLDNHKHPSRKKS